MSSTHTVPKVVGKADIKKLIEHTYHINWGSYTDCKKTSS